MVRQQDRNEQTGPPQVLHSAVGGPRPRVRRRVWQGRVRRDEVVPLVARQEQQGPVVLQVVLRQGGAHPQLSPNLPSRAVSSNPRRPIFLFFPGAATREGSGEDVRELPGC